MALKRSRLVGRLRQAISKVRFLLSFNLRRWLLSSAASSRRRHSLENRPRSPGLLDLTSPDEYGYYLWDPAPPPPRTLSPPSPATASPPQVLVKSMSPRSASVSPASSDDINQRAEEFIERFYRQLRMERQISLQLRYCKGKEGGLLERSKSDGGR
ncbi:hypothetical protein AXF42_Ash002772 [Apostasia shenzhenica]|uniref:DUF761 domain-containing protein n=1 Tax=Apostasia shenzhenica TaxID=1088818 RepID=A0A2I0A792_9ASPA|nr:hypothetical protein AXF42_Ash002772 [Apostasia shenzhenica]